MCLFDLITPQNLVASLEQIAVSGPRSDLIKEANKMNTTLLPIRHRLSSMLGPNAMALLVILLIALDRALQQKEVN